VTFIVDGLKSEITPHKGRVSDDSLRGLLRNYYEFLIVSGYIRGDPSVTSRQMSQEAHVCAHFLGKAFTIKGWIPVATQLSFLPYEFDIRIKIKRNGLDLA